MIHRQDLNDLYGEQAHTKNWQWKMKRVRSNAGKQLRSLSVMFSFSSVLYVWLFCICVFCICMYMYMYVRYVLGSLDSIGISEYMPYSFALLPARSVAR